MKIDISQWKTFDFREWPDFDAKNKLTELLIQSFFLSERLLIVTLMKEIETVVTQKHHFDNRDQSFQEILDYQDFDANININGFSAESSFTGVWLSFEILVDKLKPGVAENNQFE